MTKRKNKLAFYGLAVFLVLGFNAACSKQLLPPDVESSGSGSEISSSLDSGSGSSGGGFNSGDVSDDSGSTGNVADAGDPGSGFNINAESETSARPNDGFTGSSVGDGSGSMGSSEHGDMNFGSNDQNFGSADPFSHDTDANGSFGFGGGAGGDGASGGSGGSGSGMAGGSGGQFGSSGGQMAGGSGGQMAGGSRGSHEEARLLTFKPSDDLKDVHFEYDKYDLDENTKEVLKANAEWLKSNPGARVEIQGHCDERGTNNYNLGLGERRAISTKKYLMALGVDETRLFTISYGEEKPFCFESSENCWLENRRAHFMVAQ